MHGNDPAPKTTAAAGVGELLEASVPRFWCVMSVGFKTFAREPCLGLTAGSVHVLSHPCLWPVCNVLIPGAAECWLWNQAHVSVRYKLNLEHKQVVCASPGGLDTVMDFRVAPELKSKLLKKHEKPKYGVHVWSKGNQAWRKTWTITWQPGLFIPFGTVWLVSCWFFPGGVITQWFEWTGD